MKRIFLSLSLALLSLSVLVPQGVEAKRLGGGNSMGMRRSVPPNSTPTPATPAAPAAAPHSAGTPPAAAAAAAPKRSWMGPLAGLAAGLGLGALMSHLGLGGAMGSLLTMVLIAIVAFVAIRFLMRRFMPQGAMRGMQFAGAGAGAGNAPGSNWQPAQPPAGSWNSNAAPSAPTQGMSALSGTPDPRASSATPVPLPAGFDAAGFERIAKLMFIRMQAANDVADLNDLRSFTTPEMFAAVKLDLQERGGKTQQTDVVKLDAQLLEAAEDGQQQIVSMRFHGLIREEHDGIANPFDEVWHLVRPLDNSREWAIAGIAPSQAAMQ